MLGQVEDSSLAALNAGCHNDGALKDETRARPGFVYVLPVSNHV